MQVTLLRNNENVVRLDNEFLCDQANRHCSVTGKYLVKPSGERSDVIDDYKSNAHVARKVLQKADIGVEATG